MTPDQALISADVLLDRFAERGDGESLLLAYSAWFDAHQRQPDGTYVDAVGRRLLLSMAPMMTELLEFVATVRDDNQGTRKRNDSELLMLFRHALRIGDGLSPHEMQILHRKRVHVGLFRSAYEDLLQRGEWKSETAIATCIAEQIGRAPHLWGMKKEPSRDTVLNHWKEHLLTHEPDKAIVEAVEAYCNRGSRKQAAVEPPPQKSRPRPGTPEPTASISRPTQSPRNTRKADFHRSQSLSSKRSKAS